MTIKNLMKKDLMIFSLKEKEKAAVLNEMVQKMVAQGYGSNQAQLLQGLLDRESQVSTGIGEGIAMPHVKSADIKEPLVLFAKSESGVDFDALDGELVHLFFLIAVPETSDNTHLETISALSKVLNNSAVLDKLKQTTTPEQVFAIFDQQLAAEDHQENIVTEQDAPFIVAVTACPTGIAHTYMAEDSLIKKATEMGVRIKVETNGSKGVGNELSAEDIKQAKGVIIAADTNVSMNRFAGKPLLNRKVTDAIRQPDVLINQVLNDEAPVYQAAQTSGNEESTGQSTGSNLYKHLMSGVTHMLPFVIGGGIAIAIAFLIDQMLGVPNSELSQLGSYNQMAAYFKQIGDAAFGFMLPVLAGFIARSIADRPGLVAGFVAGAIASTGGAGFLGALIGGFLAGYIVNFLKKVFAKVPQSFNGIVTILFYPVFGVIITGALMLVVNVPMSIINNGLNNFLNGLSGTNAALLGALVGGMMAIDLGGPINKAAYVFGTGTLAATVTSGGSIVMAAVMAGGMVPPLAIFFASLLFKNKFSKDERSAGLTNLVMGLSFITEGAIPFAAANPLKVLPGFFVGSALAGALVSLMSIKLMAPHGGIFVIFLINKPLLYLLFILIGALVSAVIIGLLRNKVVE
ncbi:PTS fructose transporter subunit IIABC [Vagococcus xieshaowenii]|uniref:PTS fructose transporter subunit IIC n=1 Tax=Vagococcus xieshaowenii TaxID=2562451 RepID=A0AAJ5ED81_9ENTE|nr:fructose-specific PTS transporter subunit EIIC [Vagococcus xieshaowenii]QCA29405.1 PTS fructose transporter subunit IIC [Vagococcus xieshaowenii]TFZ39302.1 PTS fructose transporter subunit IIC [Vagococcus xieshaowenii]